MELISYPFTQCKELSPHFYPKASNLAKNEVGADVAALSVQILVVFLTVR